MVLIMIEASDDLFYCGWLLSYVDAATACCCCGGRHGSLPRASGGEY
jgi:hypothetical protein